MHVFEDYAAYYNLFYKDKDYAQEAVCADRLLKKYGGGAGGWPSAKHWMRYGQA